MGGVRIRKLDSVSAVEGNTIARFAGAVILGVPRSIVPIVFFGNMTGRINVDRFKEILKGGTL